MNKEDMIILAMNSIYGPLDQQYEWKNIRVDVPPIEGSSSTEISSIDTIKRFGMGDKVAVINVEESAEIYMKHKDDESFKAAIKGRLCDMFAKECMKKTSFSQIKTAPRLGSGYEDHMVRIIGRCVVLSLDEFASILKRTNR